MEHEEEVQAETLTLSLFNGDSVVCPICGEGHICSACTFIEVKSQVLNTEVPSRAYITLPSFINIVTMADQRKSAVANSFIECGTRFGPLEAQTDVTLDTNVEFPLKVFGCKETHNAECYLNTCDENKCNWMIFVLSAQYLDEQNLICYQEHSQIFYVTVTDIQKGDHLKVWYAPYYALRMNKELLKPDERIISEKPIVLDELIKVQQNIVIRENWTCKFCGQVETYVSEFAKHIRGHYSNKQKNVLKSDCDICIKTFDNPKIYRRHMRLVHPKVPKSRKKTKEAKSGEDKNKDDSIGGPLFHNLLNDSMDNTSVMLNISNLPQLNSTLQNNDDDNILLDLGLNVENLINDNVKQLDHFNFEVNDAKEEFVCDICLKVFTELHRFLQHLNRHTGKFTCQHCLKVFSRHENLNAHSCNMANFSCELCQKSFKLRKHLRRHIETNHNKKKFTCKVCNKYYNSSDGLIRHNCSNDNETFTCTVCSKLFATKRYLQRHTQKVHSGNNNNAIGDKTKKVPQQNSSQKYVCEICPKTFATLSGFFHHRKTHLERTFSCKVCSQQFFRFDVLRAHMLQHKKSQAKEHICRTCNLTFTNARRLSMHRVKQHGYKHKYFKCEICDKNFSEQYLLSRHKSVFHMKLCPVCKQRFESLTALKSHMFEHTDTCYQCPVCHSKMKLKSSLSRHLKKLHPNYVLPIKSTNEGSNITETEENDNQTLNVSFDGQNIDIIAGNVDFEDYSSCQSIFDNFEELLNEDEANFNKEIDNDLNFAFENFDDALHDSYKLQNVRNAPECLSMPDIEQC